MPGHNEMLSYIFKNPGTQIKGRSWNPVNYAKDLYAQMKSTWEQKIGIHAFLANVEPTQGPCSIICVWYEPNERRDQDNVTAMKKIIIDALRKKSKVINGDGWKAIRYGFADLITVDKQFPRVEVFIVEGGLGINLDKLNSMVINIPRDQK
jgi:hypothetical protein